MENFEKLLRKRYGSKDLCLATCNMLSLFRTCAVRIYWLRHEITVDMTRMAKIILKVI